MSKLQEVVNDLLEQMQKRNNKIQQKIRDYENQESKVNGTIDDLVRKLIEYDLADDVAGQEDTNKKITQQKELLDDIHAKISAYKDAINDPEIVKSKMPDIITLAKKERVNRNQATEQKRTQKQKFEKDMETLKQQIESIDKEIHLLVESQETKVLVPLLKYIEERPIKYNGEKGYLACLISGETDKLDQYIEVPSPAYRTRDVYGNVKMEGQRNTGEKLPPEKSFAELYGIVSSK